MLASVVRRSEMQFLGKKNIYIYFCSVCALDFGLQTFYVIYCTRLEI